MPQFPVFSKNIHANQITITDKNTIKHISSVLRLKVNDELLLLDENEKAYITRIKTIMPITLQEGIYTILSRTRLLTAFSSLSATAWNLRAYQ